VLGLGFTLRKLIRLVEGLPGTGLGFTIRKLIRLRASTLVEGLPGTVLGCFRAFAHVSQDEIADDWP